MSRFASLALALVALLAVSAAPSAQVTVCTTSWTNASGGDWNTAANWDNGLPGPSDDACITLDGTYTVIKSSIDIDVNSLTVGGTSGTQSLDLAIGSIMLASGGTIDTNGVLLWERGYLEGGSTLTNDGLVVMDGSQFNARGVRGPGSEFVNAGTVRWEREEFLLNNLGGFTNTGTIDAQLVLNGTITWSGSDPGTFENTGTISVTNAGTNPTQRLTLEAPSRHEDAVLTADATAELFFTFGTHTFAGTTSGDPDGLIRITAGNGLAAEPGATWDFGGEGLSWELGYLDSGMLTNDGLVVMDGTQFNARGVRGPGSEFVNAGTVRWEREEFLLNNLGGFTNTGTIDAQLVVNGTITWSGSDPGTFENTGTISVTNAGPNASQRLTLEAPSRHEDAVLTAGATAELFFTFGPHTFAGTTTGSPDGLVRMTASSGFVAEAGATWDFGGEGFSWELGYLDSGVLTNDGLVVMDGTQFNARGVRNVGSEFVNAGTVRWEREEFLLNNLGGFTNTGTIDAQLVVNGTITWSGSDPGTFENTGTVSVTNAGPNASQRLTIIAPSRHEDAVLTAGATAELFFDTSEHTFAGTTTGSPDGLVRMTSNGGIVAEPGAIWDFGGEGLSWELGFLTSGILTNDGLIVLDGSNFNGRGVTGAATEIVNAGTIRWEREEFTFSGGATWRNDGTLDVDFETVSGVLRPGTGGGSFTNAGTVLVTTGTLDVNIPFDHQAGAVIGGTGTFDIAGSTFTHDGDTAPGTSPGILTWNGKPWAAPMGGTLTVEIAGPTLGTEYDQLNVTGAATLDGTLEIDVASTAGLTVGDTFTILTASGGVTGTFSSIAVGGVPGPEFTVTYNANDVVLELTSLANPLTLRGRAGWRTLSTPFPDLALGGRDTYGMLRDIYTAGYLGADRDQRNNRGTANVFLYDESTGEFAPPENAGPIPGGSAFWVYVFIDDDSYTPGSRGGFPKTLLSSGTPATFPFDIPVTYTPGLVRGPETPALGFNLVGNPANSDLDWDDPNWTKTNVSDVLYIYDPKVNDNDGGWLTWNGTTGTLPTEGLIPVGQGFHVETTGASPALTVPSSAVLGTQSPLYRLTGDTPPEAASAKTDKVQAPEVRFRLDAAFGDVERSSEAIISFDETAALGFDRRDARLLAAAPGGTLARLYTTVGDAHDEAGAALQVASMPAPTDGVLQIDLGADVLASGEAVDAEATLAWEAVALPALWTATLVDRATGERYDLSDEGSASLSLSAADALTVTDADKGVSRSDEEAAIEIAVAAGDLPPTPKSPEARALHAVTSAGTAKTGATRFVIEIDPVGVLDGATEPEISAVYPNPASRVARVEFRLPDATDVRVALYDVLGRRVAAVHDGPLAAGIHTMALPVADLAPGTYLVRVDGTGLGQSLRLTVAR